MITGSMAPPAPELGGVTIVVFVLVMLVTMVEVLTVELVRKVVDVERVETMVVVDVVIPIGHASNDARSMVESAVVAIVLNSGSEPTIQP
jgi:hypothetical protein